MFTLGLLYLQNTYTDNIIYGQIVVTMGTNKVLLLLLLLFSGVANYRANTLVTSEGAWVVRIGPATIIHTTGAITSG